MCQKRCYPMAAVVFVSLSLFSVCSLVIDCELKRAGGRALSLSSRPPAVEYPRPLFFCGRFSSHLTKGALGARKQSPSNFDLPIALGQRDSSKPSPVASAVWF